MAVNTNQPRRVQLQSNRSGFNFEENRKRLDAQKAASALAIQQRAEQESQAQVNAFPPSEPETVKKSFMEKILAFTGGNTLARGAGLGIAQFGTKKTMDSIQQGEGEMQQKLIQAIKKNKAEGKDTTNLVNALKQLTGGIAETGNQANDLYTEGITSKQVVGDALQLATTATTAYKAPSVLKGVVSKPGIIKGTIQGFKTGAISGAGFGGASGFSQGLKQDKSIVDSLKQGVGGAVGGAVTGGVIGGVAGGISGGISKYKQAKSASHIDAITPKVNELTPTEYEKLLSQGKISPKTSSSPAQYILSPEEINTANKYKNILTSKDPVKNVTNVIDEIAKKDGEVEKFLRNNNGIFNGGQLKNRLVTKLDDISDINIDPARLANAKKSLVDNFVNTLDKKDMHSLWKARKALDKSIEKVFGGSPTTQNQIKRELRNGIQDFIADKTPNTVYADFMKDMSSLFNVKDVLTTKASKEKLQSGITLWLKHNPGKTKALEWILGGAAASAIGTQILKD